MRQEHSGGKNVSDVVLRLTEPGDSKTCGQLIFEAFRDLADRHGFERDFPSAEVAAAFVEVLQTVPTCRGLLATANSVPVGCVFIDLADPVAGIGPIAVDGGHQGYGIGRSLMQGAIDLALEADIPNIRFMQSAYNNVSMGLYTNLGFRVQEPLAVLQGPALLVSVPGHEVAAATIDDLPACRALCLAVHGYARDGDLSAAIQAGSAMLVRRHGQLCGYTTGMGFGAHTVAEDNEGLKALVAAAPAFWGPGFILPMTNHAMLRWCLANGLRIVLQMNLMSMGLYSEPSGAWMPSVLR